MLAVVVVVLPDLLRTLAVSHQARQQHRGKSRLHRTCFVCVCMCGLRPLAVGVWRGGGERRGVVLGTAQGLGAVNTGKCQCVVDVGIVVLVGESRSVWLFVFFFFYGVLERVWVDFVSFCWCCLFFSFLLGVVVMDCTRSHQYPFPFPCPLPLPSLPLLLLLLLLLLFC